MIESLARMQASFRAPAPPHRLSTLRILVGAWALVALAVLSPALLSLHRLGPSRFAPVGPLAWLCPAPPPLAVVATALVAGFALGVAFVAGWRFHLTGKAFAVVFLLLACYRNSWGMIFHSENLGTWHLLVLGFVPAAQTLSVDARAGRVRPCPDDTGWPVKLLAAITVATYFLAGIAKLRAQGLGWASGEVLANQIAFDNLRKIEFGSVHSALGGFLSRTPAWLTPLAAGSLAVELLAPVALLHPRLARGWALGAWLFHLGIVATMAIAFPYPLSGLAFAPLLPVERLAARLPARFVA